MSEVLLLDRMAVEEAGPKPEALAAEIHRQIGPATGPVPVEAVAEALDIVEVRAMAMGGVEGALVAPPERGYGVIVVKASSGRQRRRFTIAHELGHFLNIRHEAVEPEFGFACQGADIGGSWRADAVETLHKRQEAEANRFAIELLAPASRLRRALRGIPDLEHVITIAEELDISRESTARRYSELHEWPTAVVLSENGIVRYSERSPRFPFIQVAKGTPVPPLPRSVEGTGLSNHEEADPVEWAIRLRAGDLVAQTLHQQNGFAITLLAIERADSEDED